MRLYPFLLAGAFLLSSSSQAADTEVTFKILAENGDAIPCRIHLRDGAGKPVQAPTLPNWRDHFVCPGEAALNLAPGEYKFEIERGPEYAARAGAFTVPPAGGKQTVTGRLKRLTDLKREGWWSGDLHVHRPLADIQLLMRAEDLHIAPVITWWNKVNPWTNGPPPRLLETFDTDRFYHRMGGEDERAGGALLYFNLSRPLNITGSAPEFPSPMRHLKEARGDPNGWVDIEKPFWYDAPVWLASGLADSIGIANNHMHRGGMYPNEAWGRPRDLQKLPAAIDNGFWTQEIYYHALNSGLRIPPSAGSASGVLPNPPGYNRAYVQVEGELTWDKWWAGLRAGRVFVSNGPLLRCRANGQPPGHVFRFRKNQPLTVHLDWKIDSRDPLKSIEIIRNGKIVRTLNAADAPGELTFDESGWFLVRAFADVPHTFRFASTGPFYVEREDAPVRIEKASSQFFLDWVRERMGRVQLSDPVQAEEVLGYHREAEKFWQEKVRLAGETSGIP